MSKWKSSNIYKNIEEEILNFNCCGIELFGEVFPKEEEYRWHVQKLSIPKECKLRREMHTIAIWLSPKCKKTFEEVKEILDK